MKNILPLILLLFFMIAAVPSSVKTINLAIGDTAHITCRQGVLQIVNNTVSTMDVTCQASPIPTNTLTNTPTATSVPDATNTPVLTQTATPANTPVPTTSPTVMATLPLCPSHDPTVWHALVDTVRQCHFDHEHGDNPYDPTTVSIFGAPNLQDISYPWSTSAMENTHKHGGYKYFVYNDPTASLCYPNAEHAEYGLSGPPNCIVAARVEVHFISSSIDGLARYHSYYAEYKVCKYPDYTQCGIVKTGGWADLGVLNIPYAGARVLRPIASIDFGPCSVYGCGGATGNIIMSFPGDTADLDQIAPVGAFPCCDEPYASMPKLGDGNPAQEVWSLNNVGPSNHFGHNPYLRLLVRTYDAWDEMDAANLTTLHFFCRDGSCANNGSRRELAEMSVSIPTTWDTDGDGFADQIGYTDRYGNLISGCTLISLDCVPFTVVHMPVGFADTRDTIPSGCECNHMKEYDTTNQHWIQFPN